ncbi:hypothetical protein GTQ34_15640 [Muricauda sp. JGD-17]|uniref:Aspartyl protease n=1 Tax=Flagellimonas ochracea TaxID=2696472 RepID=A0A964TEA2_9FLAO|nr:aspartyl protease family protein [Allomuricauda ochracea]NAY93343.1 hypothetical protein [Allomuricauda ochracea]
MFLTLSCREDDSKTSVSEIQVFQLTGEAKFAGSMLPLELLLSEDGRFISNIDGWADQTIVFNGQDLFYIENGVGPIKVSFLEKELLALTHLIIADSGLITDFKETTEDNQITFGKLQIEVESSNNNFHLIASNSPGQEKVSFHGTNKYESYNYPDSIEFDWGFDLTGYHIRSVSRESISKDIFNPPSYAALGVRFNSQEKSKLETFRTESGNLFIKPKINGKAYGWFLFDSGAGISLLSTEIANELDCPVLGVKKVMGVGGTSGRRGVRSVQNISIGPLVIDELSMLEYNPDKSKANKIINGPVDGVIGWDLLIRSVIEVDLISGQVSIFEPGKYKLDKKNYEDLYLHWKVPYVIAEFESKKGYFMVDTGAGNKGVIFHSLAVDRLGLLGDDRATIKASVTGAGGTVNAEYGVLDWFDVANEKQFDLDAIFMTGEDGEADLYTHGFMGTKALGFSKIIFDYPNNRIGFVPLKDKGQLRN